MTATELKKEIKKMRLTLTATITTNLRTYKVRTTYTGSTRAITRLLNVAEAAFSKNEKILEVITSIS